jgi:hypothetical protein
MEIKRRAEIFYTFSEKSGSELGKKRELIPSY